MTEHLYPQGTPASAIECCEFACYEDEGCACPGCKPVALADYVPIRFRAPVHYPYSALALMECRLCLARLGKDWPLGGYSLDLAILTHVSHRLAECHVGPEVEAIA
jgi:hypothetical protein